MNRYLRGSDQDYDGWLTLADDPSWLAVNMREYMRKHQTLEPISAAVTDRSAMPFVGDNHGTSGPIHTSFNEVGLPIEDYVIQAVDQTTGLKKKPIDPWGGDHIGFYHTLGAVPRTGKNKGLRSYAARGYLQSNENRHNLKVICESLVSRIILHADCATGVEYLHDGKSYTIQAKREVILCGGAINSPQILELSGIGDPAVLKAAGIDCCVDLPIVGNDLQDHVICGGVYKLVPGIASSDSIYKPDNMAAAQKEFGEHRTGPLTNISSVQGYFPVSWFLEDGELNEIVRTIEECDGTEFHKKQRKCIIEHLKSEKSANLQFCLVPFTANCEDGAEDQTKFFPPPGPDELDGITMGICLQYPVSRGSVHIQSADPHEQPAINPNYLNHPADVAVVAAGMKLFDKLKESPALKTKLAHRHFPGPDVDLSTMSGRRRAVQEFNMGQYHPCGSCAMGSTADSRLKVKNVRRLRIADAAVFPNHVSGNMMSSVYALAERAADIIKEDWDYNLEEKLPPAGV